MRNIGPIEAGFEENDADKIPKWQADRSTSMTTSRHENEEVEMVTKEGTEEPTVAGSSYTGASQGPVSSESSSHTVVAQPVPRAIGATGAIASSPDSPTRRRVL